MTIKLHPEIQKTAEQLADFRQLASIDQLFTDLIKVAAKDVEFQKWKGVVPAPATSAKSIKAVA